MSRRFFHRSDENQEAMVKVLRQLGVKVHVWGEEADLICQFGGMTLLCEVRQPGPRVARKGRQARFQESFMVRWIQTTEDCEEVARTMRRWHVACASTGLDTPAQLHHAAAPSEMASAGNAT